MNNCPDRSDTSAGNFDLLALPPIVPIVIGTGSPTGSHSQKQNLQPRRVGVENPPLRETSLSLFARLLDVFASVFRFHAEARTVISAEAFVAIAIDPLARLVSRLVPVLQRYYRTAESSTRTVVRHYHVVERFCHAVEPFHRAVGQLPRVGDCLCRKVEGFRHTVERLSGWVNDSAARSRDFTVRSRSLAKGADRSTRLADEFTTPCSRGVALRSEPTAWQGHRRSRPDHYRDDREAIAWRGAAAVWLSNTEP